jgi:hypothetical protein
VVEPGRMVGLANRRVHGTRGAPPTAVRSRVEITRNTRMTVALMAQPSVRSMVPSAVANEGLEWDA